MTATASGGRSSGEGVSRSVSPGGPPPRDRSGPPPSPPVSASLERRAADRLARHLPPAHRSLRSAAGHLRELLSRRLCPPGPAAGCEMSSKVVPQFGGLMVQKRKES